jgi:hypothetical protein
MQNETYIQASNIQMTEYRTLINVSLCENAQEVTHNKNCIAFSTHLV